jgi:hypothetical protein
MVSTVVKSLHFKIHAPGIVNLVRQAYWMENRQKWAQDTLRCLNGISDSQVEAILSGTAYLENSLDGERAVFIDSPDLKWQEKLAEYLEYIERVTYVFGGRRVRRDLVDCYANEVVKRLRDSLKMPFFSSVSDPVVLIELEQRRQELHNQIVKQAGFSDGEVENHHKYNTWSPEYKAFEADFSKFIDSVAGKIF